MFSYQCSKYSTPESLVEVFDVAKQFQEKKDTVSVVVLDEVGLAEDSPSLPLKVLHPLLEDGTDNGLEVLFFDHVVIVLHWHCAHIFHLSCDLTLQVIDRDKRVAFIGISNWALDPAKINRGIMVTRGDPCIHELVHSAR